MVCVPPLFEIGVKHRPIDCFLDDWLQQPKTPHCANHSCDSHCSVPPEPPQGWKDCPDGFEPDWDARWCMLVDRYPVLKCLPPERLQDLWERALCVASLNHCVCPATGRAIIESLILHFWTIEAYVAEAWLTATAAGAIKGNIKQPVPAVNKSGGGVDGSSAYYGMTVWGAQYLALKSTLRADVTGVYFGSAKVSRNGVYY